MNKQIQSKIILYKNRVEVKMSQGTVWLRQEQIATLFGTQRPAITKHLANIFRSDELKEKAVCSVLEHTAKDRKIYKTKVYNLDAIISVGYRVNSNSATQFRIWATQVLKKHLIEGYTLNEKRLKVAEGKYQELQKALKLIGDTAKLGEISSQTKGFIHVIRVKRSSFPGVHQWHHKNQDFPW